MKNNNFPEFEELSKLAKENPEGLENLRKELIEGLIHNAPEQYHQRLRGLQFKIDMERRRAKNPIAACIKISQMMQDSFSKLREALNQMQATQPQKENTTQEPQDLKGKVNNIETKKNNQISRNY